MTTRTIAGLAFTTESPSRYRALAQPAITITFENPGWSLYDGKQSSRYRSLVAAASRLRHAIDVASGALQHRTTD